MIEIQLGDTLEADFTTHNDAGANANADSTPTFTVYKNGSAVVAITSQNATNYGTGLYRCLAAITSANGFAVGDKVSLVATATVGGDTSSVVLKVCQVAAIYAAQIDLSDDESNTQDEYSVQWFKNGSPVTSGVTSPTIQVIKRADGTDLVAAAAMTEIGSTGAYKYDATAEANRISAGEAVVVQVQATIDGATRTWRRMLSRDSAAA